MKAAWIQQLGLGGGMWWEASADRDGNNSLIQNVAAILGGDGGSGLQDSPNLLYYPNSTYDNIQAAMPNNSCVMASVATTTTRVANSNTASVCIGSSTGLATGCSPSNSTNLPSSAISSSTPATLPQSTASNTTAMTSGKDGVPACSSVAVASIGPSPICSTDYCDCSGTVAPFLNSFSAGTEISNCDYKTQPTTNSCPTYVTVGIRPTFEPVQGPSVEVIVVNTIYVDPLCTTTIGGGETCTVATYTSGATTASTIAPS
jgi:hypothetical protein